MPYRTRTYIAADWTGDEEAVDKLRQWNDSDHWSLSFTDAHDLTQARDDSLCCSIKRSLKERLDASKTFVLIVGDETRVLRKGSCQYCGSYSFWISRCDRGYSFDFRSYIDYECEKALEAGIKIIVLYNGTTVSRKKCPECLISTGVHVAMKSKDGNGKVYWDYQAVKGAFED